MATMATLPSPGTLNEELSEKVREYEVIYNKQHPDHKDKLVVNNAWKEVAGCLKIAGGGSHVKELFDNLKKIYSKKKNNLKKAQASGSGGAEGL